MRSRRAGLAATLFIAGSCAGTHVGGDASLDSGGDAGPGDAGGATDSGPPPICDGGCAVSQLAAGDLHTCALFADGRVACWGSNERSQLGTEGIALSMAPLVVPGLPPIARLIRGPSHTCALSTADELWCWGDASQPLFGASPAPRSDWITYTDDVVDVATGIAHTCAVRGIGGSIAGVSATKASSVTERRR